MLTRNTHRKIIGEKIIFNGIKAHIFNIMIPEEYLGFSSKVSLEKSEKNTGSHLGGVQHSSASSSYTLLHPNMERLIVDSLKRIFIRIIAEGLLEALENEK